MTSGIKTGSSLNDEASKIQNKIYHHHQNESNFFVKPVKPKSLLNTTPITTATATTTTTPSFPDLTHLRENSKRVKIRFLLFVEDSSGSRSNIFDSAKINNESSKHPQHHSQHSPSSPPLNLNSSTSTSTTCGGGQQQSPKLSNEMITRMVFGSFPMIVPNRTAIKVHNLKSSNMIMISNVFTYYKTKSHSSRNVRCFCNAGVGSNSATAPTSATSSVLNTPTKILNQTNMIGQNLKQNSSTDELSTCEIDEKLSVNSFVEDSLIFNASATTTPVKGITNTTTAANGIPITSASNNNTKLVTKIPASSFTNSSGKINDHKRGTSYSLNSYNLKDSLMKTYMDQYQVLPNLPESNLVLNDQKNNFLSSSSNSSSGGGVMKRLMRSFSNSLSSTNTLMNLSGVEVCENSSEIKHNQDLNNKVISTMSTSVTSKASLASGGVNNYVNETAVQGVTCEKCNRHPKLKIGVCVIYCLPSINVCSSIGGGTLSNSSLSSSFSNNSSSTSSNSSSHSPKTANQHQQHNQSFDKFSFFPHIDSPDFNNQRTSSKIQKQNSSTTTPTMLSHQATATTMTTTSPTINSNWNENFYEFFSSHLPLIEYQFKELKEKIISHLPSYFNPVVIGAPSNINNNLVVNRRNNSFSSNNSTTSSQASEMNDTSLCNGLRHQYFIQQIFIELDIFEKKFNLLYLSPRMIPTWLSINNSKKFSTFNSVSSQTSNSVSNAININTMPKQMHQTSSLNLDKENKYNPNILCDTLINNFFYLSNKLIETGTSSSSTKSKPIKNSLTHSYSFQNSFDLNSFFNSLKNSFSGSGTFLNANKPTEKREEITSICFLSRILSTILKYHLSWVLTVLPAAGISNLFGNNDWNSNFKIKNKMKTKLRKQSADWTFLLDSTNPYNALWAQLGDLHGAINTDSNKLVRTVILGKDKELVERCIMFLSYFIRCGNSVYFDVIQDKFDFDELLNNLLMNDKANTNNTTNEENSSVIHKEANINKSLKLNATSSPVSEGNSRTDSESATIFLCELSNEENLKNILDSNNRLAKENSENFNDENCNAQELPLIGCQLKPNIPKSTRMEDNLGYSLIGSYCEEFIFEFVLHGTGDRSFLNDLHEKLIFSKKNSILDCIIEESVYIVIDLDLSEIKVYSSENQEPCLIESSIGLIDSMIQSVLNMIKLFKNSEFTLLHLEDKLQEFYSKSVTMNELKTHFVDNKSLINLLEINDDNDLEFLKRILTAVT